MAGRCELILSSLKKIVVPLESPFFNVVLSFGTKVHIAMTAVPTDRSDKVLAFPCGFCTTMVAYSLIVVQRAAKKCVLPRGYV